MDRSNWSNNSKYKIAIISLLIIILFLVGIIISMFIFLNCKFDTKGKSPEITLISTNNTAKSNNYIIPYSSKIPISYTVINSFSENQLIVAADEILARHGATFPNCPNIQKHFNTEGWYKPNKSFKLTDLDSTELANYKLIENQLMIVYASINDPAISSQYVFPNSNINVISEKEISALNLWQLVIAKNEILARHGYVFSSNILNNYFNNTSWYTPCPGINKVIKLNYYEKLNFKHLNFALNKKLKTLKYLDIIDTPNSEEI